ncbi:TRAP transporter substrate-binding protein DctP [Thioclava pacifica]|uniref:C4-dicarboxylate ABC transporter n=1 Tax=Thioclava pacifica DSM 10166 TaxID=1353537 RepID=A0A074JIJ5_9RHOB|nr:TRAP transporter substrate-binding protein DctP [Thioclava pacifica]KEO55423.1 hypothetical protein TP2_15390 [Thioclava pacifica DSM 10166]
MSMNMTRRALLAVTAAASVAFSAGVALAEDKIKLRLSAVNNEADARAVTMTEIFAPAVAGFAEFEPHWSGTLFKQGTELEAIARGNLEMSITSAQELSEFIPAFSIFTAGYVMQSPEHQVAVFNDALMDPLKKQVEDELGVKLLAVMYLGKRQVNLRGDKKIMTPADLDGVKLRMPGSEAWQFLGKALGASPVPIAYTELYTALQTGAVDGQDNPLPNDVNMKFYEVTDQIVLTSHLVDLNYIAFSKKVWDSLTPEQQDTVQKAALATAEAETKMQLANEEKDRAFLEEKGLVFNTPDVAAFRKHVQEAYLSSDLSKNWPEGMLEKINALGEQ